MQCDCTVSNHVCTLLLLSRPRASQNGRMWLSTRLYNRTVNHPAGSFVQGSTSFQHLLSVHVFFSSATFAMNSSAQPFIGYDVYLGIWTNWSHGKIREATLTVSRRNGGLLTAFLALLVGVAGTSFWRIGCFFIHRYFSSKVAADALYHQRQVILRNSSNSQSGFFSWYKTLMQSALGGLEFALALSKPPVGFFTWPSYFP